MKGTVINNLKLIKVVDGDTIKVLLDDEQESIRFFVWTLKKGSTVATNWSPIWFSGRCCRMGWIWTSRIFLTPSEWVSSETAGEDRAINRASQDSGILLNFMSLCDSHREFTGVPIYLGRAL